MGTTDNLGPDWGNMIIDDPLAKIDLADLNRAVRKAERARLRGKFTPTKSGPNRKHRRAKRD